MSEIKHIKAALQDRIDQLARELAPGEERCRLGQYWMPRNPVRADDARPGSFWIVVSSLGGKTPGAWREEASGDKGDVIDLIAYTQRLDRAGALKWARDWLGFDKMTAEERRRHTVEIERRRKVEAAGAKKRAEQRQRRAVAMYLDARKRPFQSSPAARYLLTRGIDLARLPRQPGVLGWLPDCRHAETDTRWPVLVAGLSGDDGRICAVHRTWLERDGTGKAPLTPVRKIWPSLAGLTIKLWRGSSLLTPKEAAAEGLRETLVLCEGVEDGLSIALARPDYRVWAAGSLGNLATIRLPDCCDRVIVAADNDWGKPQAEAALADGLEALSRQGRRVMVARSPIGKDFNDALKG